MKHKRMMVKLLNAIVRVKLADFEYAHNPAFTKDLDSLADNDEIQSMPTKNKSIMGFFDHMLKHDCYDSLFDVMMYFWENQKPAVKNVFGYTIDELHEIYNGKRFI